MRVQIIIFCVDRNERMDWNEMINDKLWMINGDDGLLDGWIIGGLDSGQYPNLQSSKNLLYYSFRRSFVWIKSLRMPLLLSSVMV